MPPRTELAIVVHFHQPVGNLDRVVRAATERCYRPFLEVLDSFPDLPMTLHYSGCLLEWLEANEPDVPETLARMVDRGQVELLTGGFYEPVLAGLPHRDRVGQIEALTEHLRDRYEADPSGLWLAERVWEQDVVPAIVEAGVRYTILDDTVFHSVGIVDDRLTGPFVTDHEDRPLLVYAGDRTLRYLIPYKRVRRVLEYLARPQGERLYVYADDGEKFGEWPDTYERVYSKHWLRDFFGALVDGSDRVGLVRLGDHAAHATPVGRAYLPSSSYDEMMTWALPNDARLRLGRLRRELQQEETEGALPFLRGAPWRAFLAKYPEVNHLQKRMIHVSRHVHDAGGSADAIRELYRSQCNCAYWHGAFGGVYLGFMRTALWHHLLRAEALAQVSLPSETVYEKDFDADLRNEVFVNGAWGCAVVAPHRGGSVIELGDWGVGANVLAAIGGQVEAYHLEDENPPQAVDDDDDEMEAIQARPDMERAGLTFDDGHRGALVDLVDGERWDHPYDYEIDTSGLVRLWSERGSVKVEKRISADAEELLTVLEVTNVGEQPWSGTYATEASIMLLNLGRETGPDLLDDHDLGWRLYQDEAEVSVEVTASESCEVSREALETGSASLEGLQRMRQGSIVRMTWRPELAPGGRFQVELRWRVVPNPDAGDKKERGVST